VCRVDYFSVFSDASGAMEKAIAVRGPRNAASNRLLKQTLPNEPHVGSPTGDVLCNIQLLTGWCKLRQQPQSRPQPWAAVTRDRVAALHLGSGKQAI
jgi:hypothetical protein